MLCCVLYTHTLCAGLLGESLEPELCGRAAFTARYDYIFVTGRTHVPAEHKSALVTAPTVQDAAHTADVGVVSPVKQVPPLSEMFPSDVLALLDLAPFAAEEAFLPHAHHPSDHTPVGVMLAWV
jgi:hypothetical protein